MNRPNSMPRGSSTRTHGAPWERSPNSVTAVIGDGGEPLRIVVATLGLDGHDRGLKVVARILRDAGMEVIYLGLRQTADSIARAALDEDADAIGISLHNGGHLTLAPRLIAAVRDAGLDVPVIV